MITEFGRKVKVLQEYGFECREIGDTNTYEYIHQDGTCFHEDMISVSTLDNLSANLLLLYGPLKYEGDLNVGINEEYDLCVKLLEECGLKYAKTECAYDDACGNMVSTEYINDKGLEGVTDPVSGIDPETLTLWVRDKLTHSCGGPGLTLEATSWFNESEPEDSYLKALRKFRKC